MKWLVMPGFALMTMAAVRCEAKTVAYWSFEADPLTGGIDSRSLVSSDHNATLTGAFTPVAGAFTGIPLNVGNSDGFTGSPRNESALQTGSGMVYVPSLQSVVEVTNSWTIEGWFKRPTDTLSTWRYMLGTRSSGGGWLFTLRKDGNNVARYELFADKAVADNTKFETPVDLEATANVWQHIALTHNHLESGVPGKGVWKFYVDGVLYGTITNNQARTTAINQSGLFIGGRDSGTSSRTAFSIDAWRVSDEALAPSRFLKDPATRQSTTLAYWRMNADERTANAVGANYALSGTATLGDTTDGTGLNFAYDTAATPSSLRAVETIPNSSTVVENTGSAHVFGKNSYLTAAGLGARLERDMPFTIEGWIYRKPNIGFDRSWAWIFGTRRTYGAKGFHLLYGNWNANKFSVYANTSDGEDTEQEFPGTLDDWVGAWKHIALTHTPNGHENRSVFELFVDGVSKGCVTGILNSATATYGVQDFYLGSRPNDTCGAGYNDCTRVCSRVLAPNEFLNATENAQPVAASDVLAFWPLNSENGGLHLNGRDIAGSYHMTKYDSFAGRVAASAQSSVGEIFNPDRSLTVWDSPALNMGSIVFPEASVANYLSVPSINEHLRMDKDFTVEGWIRIDKTPSSNNGWHIIYSTYRMNPRWCLAIRKYSTGGTQYFMIVQKNNSDFLIPDDSKFNATVTADVLGKWRHHALVYRADEGNGTFELFINGVSCGKRECSAKPNVADFAYQGKSFLIGGRPNTVNSLIGAFDEVRVSSAALAPEEFLRFSTRGTLLIVR